MNKRFGMLMGSGLLAVAAWSPFSMAGDAPPPASAISGGKQATVDDIKELLKNQPSIKVMGAGGQVFLDGTVNNPQAKERVDKIVKSFGNVVDLTTLDDSSDLNEVLAKEVQQKIGQPDVRVKMIRGNILLDGQVTSEGDKKNAENIAKTFSEKVVNNLSIKQQMVEIDLAFVDISMSKALNIHHNPMEALQSVTVTPTASFTGAFTYKPGGTPTSAGMSWGLPLNTSFVFSFIESAGDSKILNRPHLSTLTGESASFQQGGEKGFRVVNQQAANVTFKEFGVIVSVTPMLLNNGKIRVTLSFEVSAPVAGGEGLDFSKYKTTATAMLNPGESLVMSGLVQDIASHIKKGVPFLRRIPLLGHFFDSHDDASTKRDLMLVITPRMPTFAAACGDSFSSEQAGRIDLSRMRWTEQLHDAEERLLMKEWQRREGRDRGAVPVSRAESVPVATPVDAKVSQKNKPEVVE